MPIPDLLASCWTTAGAVGPLSEDKKSPETFYDRVQAAAHAGFTGIGLNYDDLVAVRENIGFEEAKAIMAEFGLKRIELEMLRGWYGRGDDRKRADKACNDILTAAASLNAIHVKARCEYSPIEIPFRDLVREFKALCCRASDVNMKVAFEPQPMSELATPADALRLVDAAGHDAGGIIIDIWHVERSGASFETLRDIPLDRIFAVELNDAASAVMGTLGEDSANNRRFCGEGDFNLSGFIGTLQGLGYDRPWGVEIISASVRAMPMRVAVERAFRTAAAHFRAP